MEHIYKVLESHPWFAEMYKEINEFRYHPEEAVRMFSDALKIMDRNTVWYMIDEEKQEREKAEKKVSEQQRELDKQQQEIERLRAIIEGHIEPGPAKDEPENPER